MVWILGHSNLPDSDNAPDPAFPDSPLIESVASRLFVAQSDGSIVEYPDPQSRKHGDRIVLMCRHKGEYLDINENAKFEAAQIVTFMTMMTKDKGSPAEFDMVGHSMGGLVARSIILSHPGILGEFKVKNLVMLGTPNHGANPALTTLEFGDPRGGEHENPDPHGGTVLNQNAGSQMRPGSPFLRDINAKKIPGSIGVFTIAGNVDVTLPDHPAHALGDPAPTLPCVHMTQQHPQGDDTGKKDFKGNAIRVPCIHLTQQHPEGHTNPAPPLPCKHIIKGEHKSLCNDGFIRVSSVHIEASEAERIVLQEVVPNLAHSFYVKRQLEAASSSAPRPFLGGCNIDTKHPGAPMPGWLIHGNSFYGDGNGRVAEILKNKLD